MWVVETHFSEIEKNSGKLGGKSLLLLKKQKKMLVAVSKAIIVPFFGKRDKFAAAGG